MTIQIRKADDRGVADHGWLKSRHSFSFGDYFDEKFAGYSILRVINEDRIEGGTGFGAHAHRDMEIISYVVEGALEHQDSMGNAAQILPGEVQRMSAGTGIRHSEQNHLKDQITHFLQIWILPQTAGGAPGYVQKSFAGDLQKNNWVLVGSPSGRDGSLVIHADVDMYLTKSPRAAKKTFSLRTGRRLWVQVIRGTLTVSDTVLGEGDGAGILDIASLEFSWAEHSEFLLFDLP